MSEIKINKIGISGSRTGMINEAKELFDDYILNNQDNIGEIHHGDCIGVDSEVHEMISNNYQDIKIIIHPPIKNTCRAYCKSEYIKQEYDYLKRNHNIVDETDILIAFPPTKEEIRRSGTWSTIRYAKKKNKKLIIIYPDGTTTI